MWLFKKALTVHLEIIMNYDWLIFKILTKLIKNIGK